MIICFLLFKGFWACSKMIFIPCGQKPEKKRDQSSFYLLVTINPNPLLTLTPQAELPSVPPVPCGEGGKKKTKHHVSHVRRRWL